MTFCYTVTSFLFSFRFHQRIVDVVAADRSALSDRLFLPQRRHLQILRGCRRTRLPVSCPSLSYHFKLSYSFYSYFHRFVVRDFSLALSALSAPCWMLNILSNSFLSLFSSPWPPIQKQQQQQTTTTTTIIKKNKTKSMAFFWLNASLFFFSPLYLTQVCRGLQGPALRKQGHLQFRK